MISEITVVGSIGIDTIETPYGRAQGVLGGSAVYAGLAARRVLGARTKSSDRPPDGETGNILLVSVVGPDFPARHRNFLRQQKIALDGLVTVDAPTFRWHGRYQFEMAVAKTVKTELGALALADQAISGYQQVIHRVLPDVKPVTTPGVATGRTSGFLCLANIDPDVQLKIIHATRQLAHHHPRFTLLDTMNYWIEHKRKAVERAIEHVDCLVLNENEARQFFGTPNLVKAGHACLELGPEYVVIKKGEHGAMLFSKHGFFAVPGYPLLEPIDPTGAGDSFAGALTGYLSGSTPGVVTGSTSGSIQFKQMRKAVVYATAVSSFTVEGMGQSRLARLKPKEIEERVAVFRQMRQF